MYWWVNHGQTWKHEIDGGYLWSPKTESNGARSHFYSNMRRAMPGDYVLSFASAHISHVGRITDFAFSAPKPREFASSVNGWAEVGWIVPTRWSVLPVPVRPSTLLKELSALLPSKYSPFNYRTGRGNQKAYLAEVSQAVFELIISHSRIPAASLQQMADTPPEDALRTELDDRIADSIEVDSSLSETEREALIQARRGQGQFRANVLRNTSACHVTGLDYLPLLIASHIKPWRACDSARERLDGKNGLLLAPHVDKLFDRGFLSFEADGRIILSPRLPHGSLEALGLTYFVSNATRSFPPESEPYLAFHRQEVFLS